MTGGMDTGTLEPVVRGGSPLKESDDACPGIVVEEDEA